MSLASEAERLLREDFARLERVWAQLGLAAEDAVARRGEVVAHLVRMVAGMAAEEERQRDDILRSVAENRARVAALERELELQPSAEAPAAAAAAAHGPLGAPEDTSLLRLDAELEERCEALEVERERRLEEKVELESRAETLRASLVLADAEAVDLSLRHDISMTGLVRLREIVGEYEKKLELRRQEAEPAVAACQALMRDMDYEPSDDFESQVAKGIDRLSLSSSTLEALRELKERLGAKQARLSADVAQLYATVERLWKELEVAPAQRKACLKALGGDPARLPATCAAMRLLRQEQKRLNEVCGAPRAWRGYRFAMPLPLLSLSPPLILRHLFFLPQLRREHLPKVLKKHLPVMVQWWDKCFIGEGATTAGAIQPRPTLPLSSVSSARACAHWHLIFPSFAPAASTDEQAEIAEQMGLLYPMHGPIFEEALSEVADPDALIASVDQEVQRCKDLFKEQADLFKAVACIEDYRVC